MMEFSSLFSDPSARIVAHPFTQRLEHSTQNPGHKIVPTKRKKPTTLHTKS